MPNTKTNTSLAYRIGVQEYSRCFKVVCFMLAIRKVTFYKVYNFVVYKLDLLYFRKTENSCSEQIIKDN